MTPAPGIDPTALPPTRGPHTGGLISCALREARLKVSSTFSKVAGCRGRALARPPQRAGLSCAYLSAGGGLRGNPRRGFPLLFLLFVRVRRYFGRWSLACPAFRRHFFGACPKKRCRAAKERRFLPWRLHHSRERCKSVDGTFLARLGAGAGGCLTVAFAGGERDW